MWLWVWLAVIAAGIVVEFLTMSFYSVWFALSGILALIILVIGLPFYVPLIIFGISSLLCIFFLRAPVIRWLKKKKLADNINDKPKEAQK